MLTRHHGGELERASLCGPCDPPICCTQQARASWAHLEQLVVLQPLARQRRHQRHSGWPPGERRAGKRCSLMAPQQRIILVCRRHAVTQSRGYERRQSPWNGS